MSQSSQHNWGRYWGTVLVATALLLGLVAAVGALITGPLNDTAAISWDQKYPIDVENMRTATGESWSSVGSMMGDTISVIGVAVLIGVVLLVLRRWGSVLLLATSLILEVSVFVLSTLLVTRDRPDVEQLDVSPPTSSFPSGHTAAATALALSLAVIVSWNVSSRALTRLVWLLALVVGPVVAYSRIYRGMHHPTDVIVGLLMGAACVAIAYVAVTRWAGAEAKRDVATLSDEEKVR